MNVPTRIEHDSLGSVEVPIEALYGAQTQRAIDNFPISGLRMPRSFIRALGLIKMACAKINGEMGVLDQSVSDAIVVAALSVAEGQHDAHFPVDVFQTGSGTSTNMNANEVIARLASSALGYSVHPNDHVNMGQSSNDVIPSCIHLAASLEINEQLLPALNRLVHSIDRKSAELQAIVKTGRTHLMDAMPLTFGQELSGWAQQIRNVIARIENGLVRLHELALGGTAVGTGVNTTPEFGKRVTQQLATTTGIPFVVKPNYFEALSCQDTALEISGHLNTLAASLMKIGNDLRWMSSGPYAGLNEISLPALQPGSSIMPGKVNPVIPEAVCMVAAQLIGNNTTISVAAQSGNFQLNVMLPLIAYTLLQSIHLAARSVVILADTVIDGLVVNSDVVNAVVGRSPILVTALNHLIGYEKCAEIAQRAYREKRPILDVAQELTDLDVDTLAQLLDPKNLT
jgi:fumarate hydratase, class II